MNLINFVDFAPIFEALEALASFAMLVAVANPPPLMSSFTHIKSKIIDKVDIKFSQK